ncbi:hypothetical protein AK830_g3510 [Neonectria ditissima]|uniref:Heterokaryon incompatibility domain-containing protein n=1 Tax=Neonectria ditissima TaxID=78410 RepID=A0A0N8H7X6_9HYPO|nr:hypothetical protein AK830_g3510 [Neonectria ditissima]
MVNIDHYDSSTALEASAAAGCYLCRIFRARVICEDPDLDELPAGSCHLTFFKDVSLTFTVGHVRVYHEFTAVRASENLGCPQPKHLSPKRLAPETLDQDLECLIRDFINPSLAMCDGSVPGRHLACRSSLNVDQKQRIPTRLIDVGDGQSDTVRLVTPLRDFPDIKKLNYLILSYSWGQTNESAKTTRANLDERERGIDTGRLPKTIQDAVKLTQLMKIRYLWVDVICIIQPCKTDKYIQDWTSESPKMGSYYSNAHCLISALGASDSSKGLFTERPASKYQTKPCVIGFNQKEKEYIYVFPPQRTVSLEFDSAPLLKRGWCLQERVLSPRILHWSRNGLLKQCFGSKEMSEVCPPNEIPEPRREGTVVPHGSVFSRSGSTALGRQWAEIVREYSTMRFTYGTDRLAAIHGLADQLAIFHKDEYFAGVFRSHLAQGLMWEPNSEDKEGERLTCFPSWSWACHHSKSSVFLTDISQSLVKCTRADVFPSTQDPLDFTNTSKRILRLEAPLLAIDAQQCRKGGSFELIIETPRFDAHIGFDSEDLAANHGKSLSILLLDIGRIVKGIVLRPKDSYYERIGYAWVDRGHNPKELLHANYWEDLRTEVGLI